jgi:hypothetical protein
VIRGVLARSVFGLAALCALAASTGVAVPSHREQGPPGHAHVLGAYRYLFLLSAPLSVSTDEGHVVGPSMAKLHQTLMNAGVPMRVIAQLEGIDADETKAELPTIKNAGLSPIQDLAIVLALLVLALPRLARPTLRPVAEFAPPRVALELWRPLPALAPPRAVVLP